MTRNNATIKESYMGQDGHMRVLVRMDDRLSKGDLSKGDRIFKFDQQHAPFTDGQRVRVENGEIVG